MKLFGTLSLQSLLGITVLALGVGCSKDADTRQVSGDVKTRLPWAAEGGEYSLQEVLLQGVSSLYELSGTYVNFYFSPAVQGNKISGHSPKTRFLKSGDLWIPQDPMTQQMAVIYAHTQRLAELDVELGAGGVNTWPRDVGISVRYTQEGRSVTNNAFYDGETDSMLVVPYTDDKLPIPINAGILAHEHFHSLYFKIVEKKLFQTRLPIHGEELRAEILGQKVIETETIKNVASTNTGDYYKKAFSRGINEGLADFWAWIYTGDPDFLATSLPSERKARSLNFDGNKTPTEFMTASRYKFRVDNSIYRSEVGESCMGGRVAYCLGSDYARTLKYLAGVVQSTRDISSVQARHLVGQAVVKSLPLLRDALAVATADKMFEPVQFFEMIQNNLSDLQPAEKTFLEDLVKNTLKMPLDVPNVASIPKKAPDQENTATITLQGTRGTR